MSVLAGPAWRSLILATAAACLNLGATPAAAADPPPPGWVNLPLADYLALVERAEAEARRAQLPAEPAVARLLRQRVRLTIADGQAEAESLYEVELAGAVLSPVALPWLGLADAVTLEPREGASLHRSGNATMLVAGRPGRYSVTARSRLRAEESGGARRFSLPAAVAPVAVAEVDLPGDLAWSAPGAVVAEDRVEGDRRRLSLALPHDQPASLELRRRTTGAEEERSLARAVVVTLVELLPAGLRRHDVVLYEVLRGELSRFEVELPAGRQVDLAATDEGEVAPLAPEGRLVVERGRRLTGVGHLVLTSREPLPAGGGEISLAPVSPRQEVRARYLVLASSVAAEARPLPADAWRRVDLDDLPAPLRREVDALEPSAVWRLADLVPAAPVLAVAPLPPAPRTPALVRSRATTTVLSLEGTLLHRERFELEPGGAAFELTLPPAASLWTATVDGEPVRPVVREGKTLLPLPFRQDGLTAVEVVSVEERERGDGRGDRLPVALAEVASPVLEHTWRLLLPEDRRYRVAGSTLAPVPVASGLDGQGGRPQVAWRAIGPGGSSAILGRAVDDEGRALPGVTVTLLSPVLSRELVAVTDLDGRFRFDALARGGYEVVLELEGFSTVGMPVDLPPGRAASLEAGMTSGLLEAITVTSEAMLLDMAAIGGTGAKTPTARDPGQVLHEAPGQVSADYFSADYFYEADALRQGLVGGVKPLPIAIPEAGKLILLAGALPPREVEVELEIRAGRRGR